MAYGWVHNHSGLTPPQGGEGSRNPLWGASEVSAGFSSLPNFLIALPCGIPPTNPSAWPARTLFPEAG